MAEKQLQAVANELTKNLAPLKTSVSLINC
ncbi:Uncharacterised protein [Escherichia coli]|nr:Uncharacterised protein [Escherichia coli]CAD6181856.1 Uncharacterised protein [Escherichia coli]